MRAVVSRFGSGHFQQALEVGSDHFVSDVDQEKGGNSTGHPLMNTWARL